MHDLDECEAEKATAKKAASIKVTDLKDHVLRGQKPRSY
jgi:hypothetical protein